MTRPQDSLRQSLGQLLVQQMTRDLSQSHNRSLSPEENLTHYQHLLHRLWQYCLPLLGQITTQVILERALTITQVKYPLIRDLSCDAEGISVEPLRNRTSQEQLDYLCEALHEFSSNLIDLLALLTGEILLKRIVQEIARR